jgi:hypothetical protein
MVGFDVTSRLTDIVLEHAPRHMERVAHRNVRVGVTAGVLPIHHEFVAGDGQVNANLITLPLPMMLGNDHVAARDASAVSL